MDTADRLTVIDAVVVWPARSVDLPARVGSFADHEPHVPLDPTLPALNEGHHRAFEAIDRDPNNLVDVAAVSGPVEVHSGESH